MEYWRQAIGIDYELRDPEPAARILIRYGTDVPAGAGGQTTLEIANGGVIVRVRIVIHLANCTPQSLQCRIFYRHELGHALGFFGHSAEGLMSPSGGGTDLASARDIAMLRALYSLPSDTRVAADGSWVDDLSGNSGRIDDAQVVADLFEFHLTKATGGGAGQCSPNRGFTCRWPLPIRVYVGS